MSFLKSKIIFVCYFVTLFVAGCARKKISLPEKKRELPALPAFFDARPSTTPVSYIYSPGLTGTEMMMGRYCPQFTAVTGEKFTWRSGGQVIGEPHTAVVYPEIDLHKPGGFTLNPLTAIMNGFRHDLFPVAQRFVQDKFDFTMEDNPESDKSVFNYGFKLNKANIGQRGDIKALRKTYNKHIQEYPETDVILYGDSRGAATIFNFIARHKPAYVKAAVLEGIFDTVEHCVTHFLYPDKGRRAEKRLHNTLSFVMGNYRKNGPSPRMYAETIGDDIPLLFVTSLKDEVVPAQGTIYLYQRLKERGHTKIHLLVLKNASHVSYMMNNPDDKKMYETVVHAFYQYYGLPHNSLKAAEGQSAFMATQPTCAELDHLYPLPSCVLCE